MASITTPVTVVAQPYDTSGNGGRKLVRLSNGWLVAAVWDNTNSWIRFYKSTDNGSTWTDTGVKRSGSSVSGFSIATNGTIVYLITAVNASPFYVCFGKFNPVTDSNMFLVDINVDTSQTSLGNCSLAINNAGTELHAAWASKNSTYPNSFNIRYAKGTIDGNGNVTWGSVVQRSSENTSGNDLTSPSIVVDAQGRETIVSLYKFGTGYNIYVMSPGGTKSIYGGGTYAQSNPCAVVDGNGVIHVVWEGLDSTDNTKYNIRYSKSTDGGVTWAAATKLTSGNLYHQQQAVIARDNNNKLYVFWGGIDSAVNTTYFQVRKIEYDTSWSSITTLTNNTSGHAWKPSIMEKEVGNMIGYVWQDNQASAVKFASITLNRNPTLTLTSPTDNQVLAEGSTFPIAGEASDADNGNVVTVKYKINNGTARAIASGVSDGSSPLSFAKTLTYSNKRLWDGAVDVTGADLAENVDHVLTVWAEDDQGGKSEEVTRKFRVIWNRPPTISGENGDLGIMEEPPSVEYTVTDPETNPFTVTEKINGQVIRTFAGVAGQQETVTIPPDMWLRLEPGVQHELTIEAADSQGMTAIRTYTLTRFVDKIIFTMDFETMPQETKDFFTTDVAAKRLLLTPIWELPPGAILLVEVCNNAYDAEPTWEDATIVVKLNRAHLFSNETKTADKWGINFRFQIEKGSATQPIYLKGVGGAFD